MYNFFFSSLHTHWSVSAKINSSPTVSSGTIVIFLAFWLSMFSMVILGVLYSKLNINLFVFLLCTTQHNSFSNQDRISSKLFSIYECFSIVLVCLKAHMIFSPNAPYSPSSLSNLLSSWSDIFSRVL